MNHFSQARRNFCAALAGAGLISTSPSVFAQQEHNKPEVPRIAVCFGSGALHGYTHVGVINAFEKYNFKPDLICGTSIGAVVGALWAAGFDASRINQIAKDRRLLKLGQSGFPLFGRRKLTELQLLLDDFIKDFTFESMPTDFATVATDLDTGRRVTLHKGPVTPAVVASASMPLRYKPVTIEGLRLVDGALVEPVPVNAARELGATYVIGIDVAYRPYEEPVDDFDDVPFQMFHILVNRLIDEQLKQADFQIKLDVHEIMRNSDDMGVLVRAGEQAVQNIWPNLEKALLRLST